MTFLATLDIKTTVIDFFFHLSEANRTEFDSKFFVFATNVIHCNITDW